MRNIHTIHLDNCGGSPMHPRAQDALRRHMMEEADIGPYRAADGAQHRLTDVYRSLARLINAKPDTIAITQSATQAWLQAFHGLGLKPGDEVIVHEGEYRANVIALEFARQHMGLRLQSIGSVDAGGVDLNRLENAISSRTRLIALTWLPSNDGLINPAQSVCDIASARNIPVLLDACQAVGQMPVDVQALGCTFLTATGRKFLRGPRGTGFLYVDPAWIGQLQPAYRDQQSVLFPEDARRLELFERNIGDVLALGAAADAALAQGLADMQAHIDQLADMVRTQMQERPKLTCLDTGTEQSGIITFTVSGHSPQAVKDHLWHSRITSSISGQAFAPLNAAKPELFNRIGLHAFNTADEVDVFLDVLDLLA